MYKEMRGADNMQGEDIKTTMNANMPQEQRKQHEDKARENRRVDRKAFVKFILILVASAMVGFCVGIFSVMSKGRQDVLFDALYHIVDTVAPFASIVLTTITLILVSIWQGKARKLFQEWDGEDEELIEQVEMKLSYGMIATSVNVILSYLFFTLAIFVTRNDDPSVQYDLIRLVVTFVGFLYAISVSMVLQKQLVNFTKEINPEKQGSVFDTKFNKSWIASCDESEKQQVYQAGYKAWQFGGHTCIFLWVICFIGMMTWDFGIMPVVMVLTIWLVMTIRYYVECIRLSKHE